MSKICSIVTLYSFIIIRLGGIGVNDAHESTTFVTSSHNQYHNHAYISPTIRHHTIN